MEFLVLDLETVPKTETAHTWTPKIDKDGKEEFPPLHVHKICCIGYCILRDPNTVQLSDKFQPVEYNTLFDYSFQDSNKRNEKDALTAFSQIMDKMNDRFVLVTWNGRTFDLPVLVYRMFSYGLDIEWYYGDKEVNGRYGKRHIDVMDTFCNFGTFGGWGRAHLDSIAKLSGLPGKMEVTGDSVSKMHEAEQYDDIQEYCLTDVLQTALVFLRFGALAGKMDKKYASVVSDLILKKASEDSRKQVKELFMKTDMSKFFSFYKEDEDQPF